MVEDILLHFHFKLQLFQIYMTYHYQSLLKIIILLIKYKKHIWKDITTF